MSARQAPSVANEPPGAPQSRARSGAAIAAILLATILLATIGFHSLAFAQNTPSGTPAATLPIVHSAAAEDVAVTIYRDNLALVIEKRRLNLPGGAVKVEFEGVLGSALPASATLAGLEGLETERNFDFDGLSPASLLSRSLGAAVTRIRTDPSNGRETSEAATIAAAGDGIVLRFADHVEALDCAGAPERLIFDRIPDNLRARPTLSTTLSAGAPAGEKVVTLAYLATQMRWSTHYVVTLGAGETAAIQAWIKLENDNDEGFHRAALGLVAGDLSRVFGAAPPAPRLAEAHRACWPEGSTAKGSPAPNFERLRRAYDEIVVTGARFLALAAPPPPPPVPAVSAPKAAEREELGDYQLYLLPERSELNARSQKQSALLAKPAARFERLYRFTLPAAPQTAAGRTLAGEIVLKFQNRTADGLGEPLPKGDVRVFAPGAGGGALLAGQGATFDTPVGQKWEFTVGQATGVTLRARIARLTRTAIAARRSRRLVEEQVRLANARAMPVMAELSLPPQGFAFKLAGADAKQWRFEDGFWRRRLLLAPHQAAELAFAYRYDDPPS